MMQDMMQRCCGAHGQPDFDTMTAFMERQDRASKFDAAGWALFFIWIGIAWLAEAGWGVGLLGVAAITLAMQLIRKISGLQVEGFWVLVGFGIAVAGFWQWTDVQVPLAPLLFIAIGIGLLYRRVWPRSSHQGTR